MKSCFPHVLTLHVRSVNLRCAFAVLVSAEQLLTLGSYLSGEKVRADDTVTWSQRSCLGAIRLPFARLIVGNNVCLNSDCLFTVSLFANIWWVLITHNDVDLKWACYWRKTALDPFAEMLDTGNDTCMVIHENAFQCHITSGSDSKSFCQPTLSPPDSFWLLQNLDVNPGHSINCRNKTSKKSLLSVYITFDFVIESNVIMEKMRTEEMWQR